MVLYSFESLCQVLLNQNEVTSTFMDIYFLADITKSFPMNLSIYRRANLSIYRRALGESFTRFYSNYSFMGSGKKLLLNLEILECQTDRRTIVGNADCVDELVDECLSLHPLLLTSLLETGEAMGKFGTKWSK